MDGILDPVLHITPEFHELSEASLEVLPLELGSSEALATLPPQSHTTLVSGAIMEHSSDALLSKELCGLLANLETVSPGYGNDIDCVFGGLNHEGGELSKEGNYQGQKKEEGCRKESFGGCLTALWVG
jgi:hypothetical protein